MSDEQLGEHAPASDEATVPRWGNPISVERQVELQGHLDRWQTETDHSERIGPFDRVRLTGADVSWIAEQSGRKQNGSVPNLHLEGAILSRAELADAKLFGAHLEKALLAGANLEGADLVRAHLVLASLAGAHLEGAKLNRAHLERANLESAYLKSADFDSANLEDARLRKAHLEGANFFKAQVNRAVFNGAHLQHARFRKANLEGAFLVGVHLEGAYISEAHLGGANINSSHLEGADLNGSHLEGVDLHDSHLESADLRRASFDKASRLNNAVLTCALFDQVTFDNTNLTVIDWSLITVLGDDSTAQEHKDKRGKLKTREERLEEYKAGVRANRMLSVNLQAQGLAEDGDRFAYRAQVLQRNVLWYQRKFGAYLFSWLLAGLAGYGYRLRRIFIVYGFAVLLFALGYFFAGGVTPQGHLSIQQQALDSLQVSLNAIHGRVFFTQLGLDTLQSWLATLESIVGIVIEGVFVAMLIQRFFAR